jgi:hypothetical protein
MRKLIFQFLIMTIVLSAGVSFVQAQRVKQKNLVEVKIYLAKENEEYDERNPHGLVAVTRTVDARSPLRGALVALTGNVTRPEEKQKLFSALFGIKLLSSRLEKGTAYVYFTMPEEAYFSGDSSPFVFKDAVERTALQFSSVKKVVVCLDGVLNFWSESEEPARKCP